MKNLSIIFLLCLSACALGSTGTMRPLNPPFMPGPPVDAPENYKQGWNDGCETGFGAHGDDVYRSSYHFKQDPSKLLDRMYYKAWKDAENFCRTYIFEYSFRGTYVHCMIDGLTDDCNGGTDNKASVPFLGGSSEGVGYGVLGSGNDGVGSVMGKGADDFIGNTTGTGSILGDW